MTEALAGAAVSCRTMGVRVAGVELVADISGALVWPERGVLVVADLHLEKGSSFAARGLPLPPYDTADTLARLAEAIRRFAPGVVVALGDSFHDRSAESRLAMPSRAALVSLQRGRDWVWIAGNHDPDAGASLPGQSLPELALGPLTFRHEPARGLSPGEIAGHLHPVARVAGRGGAQRRRCFATCGARIVMPAFGAYAGGLNVRDRAFAPVFPRGFTVVAIGDDCLVRLPGERLLGGR